MTPSHLTLRDLERSKSRSLRFRSLIFRKGAELCHILLLIINLNINRDRHNKFRLGTRGSSQSGLCEMLKRGPLPRPNITRAERAALKRLKQDPNVMILPADKGRAVVMMNSQDHREKETTLLSDNTTYTPEEGPDFQILLPGGQKTTRAEVLW